MMTVRRRTKYKQAERGWPELGVLRSLSKDWHYSGSDKIACRPSRMPEIV